jgi:hypothetical protein
MRALSGKHCIIALAWMLLACGTGHAQTEPIPDTLDWRGYYPLQIGNEWEYVTDNFPRPEVHYDRLRVVGDTLIEGVFYYVQRSQRYNADLEPEGKMASAYLRYDTTLKTVVVRPGSAQGEWGEEEAYLVDCELDVAFNQEYVCYSGLSLHISGGYCEDEWCNRFAADSIDVAATKHFNFGGPGITLVHGIGEIGGQFEGSYAGRFLIYARINDGEYGSSEVRTSSEQSSVLSGLALTDVYPVPFSDVLHAEIHTPAGQSVTVEVFNAIGQRVWSENVEGRGQVQRVRISAQGWGAGVYILRLRGARSSDAHAVILAR